MSVQELDALPMTPLQQVMAPQMLKKSLYVAVVVGTVLTVINHSDEMMSGMALNMMQVFLTYLVPFLVSTYGAWSMARASQSTD